MPLRRGSLYLYNYLWSREHEKRETSGRKARPICLVIRSAATPAALFLFPLTTKAPPKGALALEIPEAERRRANLSHPCWIVVEEYNRVEEDELYDFESLVPIGVFSAGFLKRIGMAITNASEQKRLKGVRRS